MRKRKNISTKTKYGLYFMIDDDIDDIEEIIDTQHTKRKKLMLFLLPVVIAVGLSVGLYFAFNSKSDSNGAEFNVIQYNKNNNEGATVFYDLPEIKINVKGKDHPHRKRDRYSRIPERRHGNGYRLGMRSYLRLRKDQRRLPYVIRIFRLHKRLSRFFF